MNQNSEIEQLETEIRKRSASLQNYVEFRSTVKRAIDELLERKYAPLEKALEEFGSMEQIRDAYGWELISKARYYKLTRLDAERREDNTYALAEDLFIHIDRRIDDMTNDIEGKNRRLEALKLAED